MMFCKCKYTLKDFWKQKEIDRITEIYMKHNHQCYYCFDMERNCPNCKLREMLSKIKE